MPFPLGLPEGTRITEKAEAGKAAAVERCGRRAALSGAGRREKPRLFDSAKRVAKRSRELAHGSTRWRETASEVKRGPGDAGISARRCPGEPSKEGGATRTARISAERLRRRAHRQVSSSVGRQDLGVVSWLKFRDASLRSPPGSQGDPTHGARRQAKPASGVKRGVLLGIELLPNIGSLEVQREQGRGGRAQPEELNDVGGTGSRR